MTPDENAEREDFERVLATFDLTLTVLDGKGDMLERFRRVLRDAILAEREACAKEALCVRSNVYLGDGIRGSRMRTPHEIAEAIRGRPPP